MKTSNLKHDSALKHVTGQSVYVNDMDVSPLQLVGRVVYSPFAHARIKSVDYSDAIKLKGVAAVLTASDIAGANQMGPVIHDEPCLAETEVNFIGQAVLLIAAETEEIAIEAERRILIDYEEMEAVLSLREAIEKNLLIAPVRYITSGNADDALFNAHHRLEGELETGAARRTGTSKPSQH